MTYLFLSLTALMNCSLIFNTVKVEIPKGYQGWCYVIPVTDTTGFTFNVSSHGSYKVNEDGVAYVPANLMIQKEDLRVEIYQGGADVTDDARYFGRVATSNTIDNKKYSYVRFLIPTDKEKNIDAADAYWRDNNFGQEGRIKFDSLLNNKKIVFR